MSSLAVGVDRVEWSCGADGASSVGGGDSDFWCHGVDEAYFEAHDADGS